MCTVNFTVVITDHCKLGSLLLTVRYSGLSGMKSVQVISGVDCLSTFPEGETSGRRFSITACSFCT